MESWVLAGWQPLRMAEEQGGGCNWATMQFGDHSFRVSVCSEADKSIALVQANSLHGAKGLEELVKPKEVCAKKYKWEPWSGRWGRRR